MTHTNRATGQDQEDVALLEFLDSIFSAHWDKKRTATEKSGDAGDGDVRSETPSGTDTGNDDDDSGSSSSSGDSSGNGSGDSSGSNSDGSGGRNSDHEPWQHPALFVKGGERLNNVLLNPDQTSGTFADPEDASLRFYRHVAPGSSVDDAATGGKGTLTTLFPSDPRMLKRAREIRREINDEINEKRAELAGKERVKSLARRIQGYWPWGKHGLLRARQRENAKKYEGGEVWITLTKRGVLVRTLFPRQACDG